jgi:hypothetical protein
MDWSDCGFLLTPGTLPGSLLHRLRTRLFHPASAGRRDLLDQDAVPETVALLRRDLVAAGFLQPGSRAIQALAFDKTPETNWKVPWHQDLLFPVSPSLHHPDWSPPCAKDGVLYSRPPLPVLEKLAAVRLHLDACPLENGPLRVSPGTHRLGILPGGNASQVAAARGEVADLLLFRPLLLHASAAAKSPGHRRVLHLVFDESPVPASHWHRSL